MEPLTFKIITDADDSGVKSYDKSLGGLNTTSQKAGAALRSFSRDALEAKSGADLAAAGANALSQALQKSIVATAAIGSAKILSDQFKLMGETIRGVGEEMRKATSELQKMGSPTNLEDAMKQVSMLENSLTSVKQKLDEINNGNLFKRFIGEITGATKEIEAQIKTFELLRDTTFVFGLETERAFRKSILGASEEDKALAAIDRRLSQRLEQISKIADANARANAQNIAYDLATLERVERANAVYEKYQAKRMEDAKKTAEEELRANEAVISAKREAEKLGEQFDRADEERKKKYIQRAEERIRSIEEEIEVLRLRADEIISGSARDVFLESVRRPQGQAPTSAEVGFIAKEQREVAQARKEASDALVIAERDRLRKEAEEKKKAEGFKYAGPDPESIGLSEARKSLAKKAVDQSKAKDPIVAAADALGEVTKKSKELSDAKEEEIKKTEGSTDQFFKMQTPLDMVSASLGGTASSVISFEMGIDGAKQSIMDWESELLGTRPDLEGFGIALKMASDVNIYNFRGALDQALKSLTDFREVLKGSLSANNISTNTITLSK